MRWRFITIILFFGILYLVLVFNIYNLQLKKGIFYLTKAEFQQLASRSLEANRGNIYFLDKDNSLVPAALNKEYSTVYAVPKEIQEAAGLNTRATAEKLSALINVPAGDIEKQLNKKNDQYELLAVKVEANIVEKIKNLNLKGIYITNELMRFYPFKDLAAHLLGFVSPANEFEYGSQKDKNIEIGRYGAELNFNDFLSGKSGELKNGSIVNPREGQNLVLTIDRNIQAQAEEILRSLIEEYSAVAGTVIVQEPKTGKILAMGGFPNFDPNDYSKYKVGRFINPAVELVYEPGSVFKVITMASGIDSKKITPDTSYTDAGSVTLNGMTIKNWDLKAHGRQTMAGVIEQSINTGAVFAQRQIGREIFYDYLKKFGFGELTNIDLPGETKGSLRNLNVKSGYDVDFATASFGQGVSVTPIELISAFSSIANGGALMKPIILADEKPQMVRRVISEETSRTVKQMMVSAVIKNKVAVIENYSVAGKTGTAFIPNFGGKGYTDQVINTYMGFAPASDPKFVILIKIEKPKGAPLAGQTVVPAFRELARYILNYYNISPDNLATSTQQ